MAENSVSVIFSARKTIAISIRESGRVEVRAPYGTDEAKIRSILHEKRDWIERTLAKVKSREADAKQAAKLTEEEIGALARQACERIAERLGVYQPLVGVRIGRVTVRCQRTLWGSCSASWNLSFNCLLMLTPPEALDYVVVHELCHRKEMNHSKRFWREVERVMPDWRTWRAWLKKEGPAILARIG